MAGIWGTVGYNHSVAITHWDGNETMYPKVYVYDNEDNLQETFNLEHRALGYYSACWCAPTAGTYNLVIIVYTDMAQTIIDEETQREGRTYFISNHLLDTISMPMDTADAVWDEVLPGSHDIAHSAGLYMQVIRQTVLDTNWEIRTDAVWSLPVLEQKIMDTRTILQGEINENEVKINALSAQSSSEYQDIVDEVQLNRSAVNNHDAHLSSVETNLTGEINENEIKIDQVISQISQIQNNTRFVAVVPQKMRIPDSSTKIYQFFLAIYDVTGNPSAPDQAPRVRVVKSDGTELLAFANMTQDGAKVGQYYYDYSINSSTQENILRIEFEVVESGNTSYLSRVSETVIYDSNLDVIENKIDVIDTKVEDVNNHLTGGSGLAVINTKLDGLGTGMSTCDTKLNAIKAKTDLIISNPADKTDIVYLDGKIDAVPDISQIQARLDVQTGAIKGPDNRNLTQVYDNERGTDNALLANDPRLNFLDIAISSRSGHSVADIWSHVTRTLTSSAPLSNSEVAKIWDYLVSNITLPGSIGKWILDNLDIPVSNSTGLSYSQLLTALSPLALEATLDTVYQQVINESNENQLLINQALAFLADIKPQTDKIVNDGAIQTSVMNNIDQNQALIEGLELLVAAIKAKTDTLPNGIALQSSVEAIPTNPLLANDGRLDDLYLLNRLDVAVSTRAESFPTDYAKAVALQDVRTDIIAEVNINEAKINQLPTDSTMDTKLVRLDNILVQLGQIKGSGFDMLLHSLVKIKEGQGGSGPGGGITAQDVWEYTARELTDYPDSASPGDVTASRDAILAELPKYSCHMTTTFITQSDIQEVLCWLDKDGQTVSSAVNARIVISDGTNDLWSGTDAAPDARGVFRISKSNISSLINTADKNFVMAITIEHGGEDYTTTQPFYTVG